MAKDGTNRGGPRPGTGPKRKPLSEKIQVGKAGKALVISNALPSPAELTGEDMDRIAALDKNTPYYHATPEMLALYATLELRPDL